MSSTSGYSSPTVNEHSFSAISASNFETLNSEGGACYSGPNRGRPKTGDYGGTGAIGGYDFHSPVGDTPWWLMSALIIFYVIRRKRMQKKTDVSE